MSAQLTSLFVFYQFPTGRRLFALQELHKLAQADNLSNLATFCTTAIAHDRATRLLEARWAGRKVGAQYSPLAKQIDILVDTALGALHDGLENEVQNSDTNDPLAPQAETLRTTLFPTGVGAITSLNYVDELTEVERIVHTCKSTAWAPVIAQLGLQRRVDRIVSLESQYRTAIAESGDKLTFGEVKAARQQGQSLMLQAIAIILGLYPSDNENDLERRSKLLAPIFRQQDAIRDDLRARRPVSDVHPESGEPESSTPDSDTTTPAP